MPGDTRQGSGFVAGVVDELLVPVDSRTFVCLRDMSHCSPYARNEHLVSSGTRLKWYSTGTSPDFFQTLGTAKASDMYRFSGIYPGPGGRAPGLNSAGRVEATLWEGKRATGRVLLPMPLGEAPRQCPRGLLTAYSQ